jgi:hypothetical protein
VGDHTVSVQVENKKIAGVTVAHRTKGNVATSKKMRTWSLDRVWLRGARKTIAERGSLPHGKSKTIPYNVQIAVDTQHHHEVA